MVIGAPFAILLAYVCSLAHFTVGELNVTALTAPGLFLALLFLVQLFSNFIMFDEIPPGLRRLPLSSSGGYVDNSRLTPYISLQRNSIENGRHSSEAPPVSH